LVALVQSSGFFLRGIKLYFVDRGPAFHGLFLVGSGWW